jgi:hypothetical protein
MIYLVKLVKIKIFKKLVAFSLQKTCCGGKRAGLN